MPVRPPAVVKVLASLNSCAPELSRISAASRWNSSSSELFDSRAVTRQAQRAPMDHHAPPPGVGLLDVEAPTLGGGEPHPSPDLQDRARRHGTVGRHQTVQERQADGGERDDGGHDERPRPAPPIEAQETGRHGPAVARTASLMSTPFSRSTTRSTSPLA